MSDTTRERIGAVLDGLIKDALEWAQFDLLSSDADIETTARELVEYVPEMVNDDRGEWLDEIMRIIGED